MIALKYKLDFHGENCQDEFDGDKITISLHKVRNNLQTVLSGFPYARAGFTSAGALLTHFKKSFATGGHTKEEAGSGQQYVLNGDKKTELLKFLHKHGVKLDTVTLSGLA